jgi:hypothetical protein
MVLWRIAAIRRQAEADGKRIEMKSVAGDRR